MANTITGLIQYVYDSADIVSRELVGMIPAVYLNGKAEMVAKNQNITYDVVPSMTAEDTTPASSPPTLGDSTTGTGTMAITKSRTVRFYWSGDDEAAMGQTIRNNVTQNKFAQAFRTLTNEIETDLAALYVAASRACGSAATTPFGTAGDFSDAADAVRILKDNGAPLGNLQLVLNTAAGAKIIGKQSRADIIGAQVATLQQQGILLAMAGCTIRESAQMVSHTKGTGTSYVLNGTPAASDTSIAMDGGSGTILAGDILTFGTDTNKYVVKTALAAGSVVIANPGLKAVSADGATVTVGNAYSANMAFDRYAIHLLCRIPKVPTGGDVAQDEYIMVDPVSGIPFRIALYKGYHANQIAISTCWGVKAVKPEHIALLLG